MLHVFLYCRYLNIVYQPYRGDEAEPAFGTKQFQHVCTFLWVRGTQRDYSVTRRISVCYIIASGSSSPHVMYSKFPGWSLQSVHCGPPLEATLSRRSLSPQPPGTLEEVI